MLNYILGGVEVGRGGGGADLMPRRQQGQGRAVGGMPRLQSGGQAEPDAGVQLL